MYAFLRGTIAAKGTQHIELDVGGVGYEVYVADRLYGRLVTGRNVTLLTYCHIREDAFVIYGFERSEEKTLFTTLLGVSGIGPRVALNILSAMSTAECGRAVLESDVNAFTRVAGVGKKTAQRLVLEMKAKLGQDTELSAILGEDTGAGGEEDDVMAALLALGCGHGEARKGAAQAREQLGESASDEELVKLALQTMARR